MQTITKKPAKVRSIRLNLAVLLVVLAVVGTAAALTTNELTNERIKLFRSGYDASDFSVHAFATMIHGLNEVLIDVTLLNNGASFHAASVTVQLLDAAGELADPAASITKTTGPIANGGTFADTWTFSITGIIAAYTDVLIIVEQSS